METSNHDSEKSFLTKPHLSRLICQQHLTGSVGPRRAHVFQAFSIYDRGWGCSWNERVQPLPPCLAIFQSLFGQEDLSTRRQQMEEDQAILKRLKQN